MNSMNKRSIYRPFAVTALSAALLMTSASGTFAAETKHESAKAADQSQVTDREVISHYTGWEDPDMARIAVHGGRALLRHLDTAHRDLVNNKQSEASTALNAADDFAQGLQMMVPYTVVVDNIRNAKNKLLASSTGVVVDEMLPIYANLDEMSEYAPKLAQQAKNKLNQAVKHAKQGDKQKAAETLTEIADDISATTVYLPVLYVKDQINIARNALNQDPPQLRTAQSAIESSMDSLVHATVSMHLFPKGPAGSKTSDNSTTAADQAG
jgi:hypothetical protein